jgi:hypothetical protein
MRKGEEKRRAVIEVGGLSDPSSTPVWSTSTPSTVLSTCTS